MKYLTLFQERRFWPGIVIIIAHLLLQGCESSGAPSGAPLNVVLIMVDDMGWVDLEGYGSDLHKTPNIDRLADSGLKFTNAYASAPVCTPTRAALMTGKSPARLNMTIWHEGAVSEPQAARLIAPEVEGNLPHSEKTLAEVFQDAGYRTGHVGKWHLGDPAHYPETQGFDFTFGGTFWGAPGTFFFPYRAPFGVNRSLRYIPGIDAGEAREGEYLTDRLTDEALGFMDRVGKDPFFLYMSYYTVHTPIEGKPAMVEQYEKQIQEEMIHQNAHYAAMHESLDDNVQRILDELERKGIAKNTLVILTSDNGGFINENNGQVVTSNAPLRSGKGSLYEGGVRVPLVIYWPGVTTPGSVSNEPVHTADLYPTLLEMTGLPGEEEHNKDIDGISLVSHIKSPDISLDRTAIYWHYPHYYYTTTPVSSIRRGKWKLLEYFEDGNIELYNLETDLGETANLAETEREIATELLQQLQQWRQEVDAPMPGINPNYEENP